MSVVGTKEVIAIDAAPPPTNKVYFFDHKQTLLEEEGFRVVFLPNTDLEHGSREAIDEGLAHSKELLQHAGGLMVACYNLGPSVLMALDLSTRTHMHQAADLGLPVFLYGHDGADEGVRRGIAAPELLDSIICIGETVSRINSTLGDN